MIRSIFALAAVSTLAILAGCSVPTGDDSSSTDDALKAPSKSDQSFLMDVLTRANVPEVAPAMHVTGVGPSRTATIDLKVSSGGFVARVVKTGEISLADGTVAGEVSDADMSRVGTVLVKGGASWNKGVTRCCDIPTVDTLQAVVSCHTIVAPGSPVDCTITAAPVATETDDAFMFNLFNEAHVAADKTPSETGTAATFTAHVTVSKGGFAGVELGTISWGTKGDFNITSADLPRVVSILSANDSTWGAVGPVRSDMETTIESVVTCFEQVSIHPGPVCTFEAANIRPL